MVEASKHINQTIKNNPIIMSKLTNGIFWELGTEDVKVPFATFTIVKTPGRTKDMIGSYRTSIFVWAKTLTEGAEIADVIISELKKETSPRWSFEMAQNGYTSGDAAESYIEIVFNFNL